MKPINCCLFAFILLLSFPVYSQDTLRVPQDYPTIQEALDSAKANTYILVAPGTYYETLRWIGKAGIRLIGEMGSDQTIIDANHSGRPIWKSSGINDQYALLQGFTIQNGRPQDGGSGGGVSITGQCDLTDLKIINNDCFEFGGGLFVEGYTGTLRNVIVMNNEAKPILFGYGGGLRMRTFGKVQIIDCRFSNNKISPSTSAYGGGAYIDNNSGNDTVFISNSRFGSNYLGGLGEGAGAYLTGNTFIIDSSHFSVNNAGNHSQSKAGGIACYVKNMVMTNSYINYNTANNGMALRFSSNAICSYSFYNCLIEGNGQSEDGAAIEALKPSLTLQFTNCLIVNNDAHAFKVSNSGTPHCKLTLNHCTVANNFSGFDVSNTDLSIRNSILWNYLDELNFSGQHTEQVQSCLVEGGFPGGGNFDEDPLYLDNYAYELSRVSPCLGVANPLFSPAEDFYRRPRPVPANTLPDIGAVEFEQSLTRLLARFYRDVNENGFREEDERFISVGAISIQGQESHANFRPEGIAIAVDPGPLTVAYDTMLFKLWKVTSVPSFDFLVDSFMFSDTIEFGMTLKDTSVLVKPSIVLKPFRCDHEVDIRIFLQPENSFIFSDTLWLQMDPRIEYFSFLQAPDTIVHAHLVGWYVDELYPGDKFVLKGKVKTPGIGGLTQVGDRFDFHTWVNTQTQASLFTASPEVLCSYDPNDKQVNPNRANDEVLLGSSLSYNIRFQNTGNDYAQHVTILDTLDVDLDIGSFTFLSTSHPELLQISFEDERVIRFRFDNIFLPDSLEDFEGSQGFVAFTIQPVATVQHGTVVQNTGHILFDSNPAITTNTTRSILVDAFTKPKTFLVAGRKWIYAYETYEALPDPLVSQTFETITVEADTTMNGLVYSRMEITKEEPCGIFWETEYLREDEGKIYRLSRDLIQEFLMIDFNETQSYEILFESSGGQLDTGIAVVDSFGMETTFDGLPIEVQYLHILNNGTYSDDAVFKVAKDIGFIGEGGLLFPYLGIGLCDVMEGIRFRCHTNGIDTLHFTEFGCYESTLVSSEESIDDHTVSLFPNPATDRLVIPEGLIFLSMNDLHGRLVELSYSSGFLELGEIPAGYYLVRFVSPDQQKILTGRIVKL
jgi:uncharacterized repeat protein (TIGR01451 family)